MSGAGDREKLGGTLDDSEAKNLNESHRVVLGRKNGRLDVRGPPVEA
jgi:hypothetical protein